MDLGLFTLQQVSEIRNRVCYRSIMKKILKTYAKLLELQPELIFQQDNNPKKFDKINTKLI